MISREEAATLSAMLRIDDIITIDVISIDCALPDIDICAPLGRTESYQHFSLSKIARGRNKKAKKM